MKILASVLLALAVLNAPAQNDPNAPPPNLRQDPVLHFKFDPRKVATFHRFWLFPGQELWLDNAIYSHVHVTSDFPVAIHMGGCQATQTTDLKCDTMPNVDLFVQDLRVGVPPDSVPVNRVLVTASRE
jgi:hypothetical protein